MNYLNFSMNQPKVAIIIINWNGKHLLEECLTSAENQDYDNYKIIFVDNGSKDKSIEFVEEKFPKVEIISLDKNTGFAKGNNVGIHKAFEDLKIEYIALLNNDAMTEKSWLSEMVKVIKQDNKIGSVAPKILKYWRRDEIDSIGIKIRLNGGGANIGANEKDKKQYDNVKEVFGTTGCSCLYKRKMLEDVVMSSDNYFDNDFFAFCEDVDLAWRARLRGWKSFTAPKSVVYHKGSESFQVYSFIKAFYSHRNRLFVIFKNFPLKFLIKGICKFFLNYFYSLESIFIKKGYSAKTKEKIGTINVIRVIVEGWSSFLIFLFKTFKKRNYIQKEKVVTNKEILEWFKKFGENKNMAKEEYIKQL